MSPKVCLSLTLMEIGIFICVKTILTSSPPHEKNALSSIPILELFIIKNTFDVGYMENT